MIDINKWHRNFQAMCNYTLLTEPDEKHVKEIGTLNKGGSKITFVSDFNFIFANDKVIDSCYNCSLTAAPVFGQLMKNIYGNRFNFTYFARK